MQKSLNSNSTLYQNLGYWFLLLIVLVVAGFYTSYFAVFFQPTAPIIHIHFTLMVLWIAMLITQPFLIKYKKLALHPMLGKVSYMLVPLVLFFGFLMIRRSYYNSIDNLHQSAAQAAAFQAIALYWLLMFMVFYCLAIINRRKTMAHARYMVATALTLLGATIDRIIFFGLEMEKLPASIPIEVAAFFVADLVLALLLWKDYKQKRPTQPLWICLLSFLVGQVLFFTIPSTEGWQHVVAFLLKPTP
jgi:DMSO reductase anchor subunit